MVEHPAVLDVQLSPAHAQLEHREAVAVVVHHAVDALPVHQATLVVVVEQKVGLGVLAHQLDQIPGTPAIVLRVTPYQWNSGISTTRGY